MECPAEISDKPLLHSDYYGYLDKKVVFFGHYWLKGNPVIENNKAICLDYSVAKGGLLVAFRSEFISKENQKEGFVTKKIISTVCRIANGSNEKLALGNINIFRDWGWAPEYVDAMQRMLTLDEPEDFIISSGASISLESFIESIFSELNLDRISFICVVFSKLSYLYYHICILRTSYLYFTNIIFVFF